MIYTNSSGSKQKNGVDMEEMDEDTDEEPEYGLYSDGKMCYPTYPQCCPDEE